MEAGAFLVSAAIFAGTTQELGIALVLLSADTSPARRPAKLDRMD